MCAPGLAVLLIHGGATWFNLWPRQFPPPCQVWPWPPQLAPLLRIPISWFPLGNIDWGFPMWVFLQGWGLQAHPASWRIMVPLFVCNFWHQQLGCHSYSICLIDAFKLYVIIVDCIPVTVLGNISVLHTRPEHTDGHWPTCRYRTACLCSNTVVDVFIQTFKERDCNGCEIGALLQK